MVEALALATILFCALALSAAPNVAAAKPKLPPTPTTVTAEVPTGGVLGKDVTIGGILKDRAGNRLTGQHLTLFLDGTQIQTAQTDAHGQVSFTVQGRRLDQARTYAVRVAFSLSHGYAASAANVTLTILAAAIQIQTVPPLAGIRFTLGSSSALTGPDGVAALPVPQTGSYELSADLNPDTSPGATVKASFIRWVDNVFTANRTIDVTGAATYSIGLSVAYRANIQYVDLNNQPVDPTLISTAQFSTGTGSNDVVLDSQTKVTDVWWLAATTIRAGAQLIPSPVTYRALSVKLHGGEVVNRGQQSWTPTENGTWTIQLLLYGMTVKTQDALLGGTVSGPLTLTYPDGETIRQQVGAGGEITFDNLPRGQYTLSLGNSALTPPTQVTLSRPQSATVRVITFVDIGLIVGLGLAALAGLVILGRWSMVVRRVRRKRRGAAVSAPADWSQPTA
jgi:hypothetical protein